MSETSIMNIQGIDCYELNGVAYLKLEAVARGLGFTQNKNGAEYVKWERVIAYLKELGFSPEVGKDDYIPENIFYRLAMKAKNEVAERFQAKVADEIIPAIRRTGSYSAMPTDYLTALKALVAAEEERVRLAAENKALLPKAEYHDEVLNKPGLICTSTIAKDLGLSSAAKLNKMLNDHNVIYRDGSGTWKTYAEYEYLMTDGYADYQSYTGANTKPTLKWTEKGRKWLSEKVQVWA